MHWEGKKVGVGTLTFKEVIPFEKIVYDLSFEAPFKSKSEGTFLFSMNNNQLTVEWQDHGNLPYPFGRLLDMIWSFDELIGRDFEIGLSRLDSVTGRLPRYQLEEFHIVMLPGSTYLTMPISTQIPKVSDELHNGYNALYETAAALGLSPAGGGVCFYHVWDETGVEMEPALPLMQTNISEENLPEGFKIKQIPDQEALRIVYTGYPDAIGSAYEALEMFMDAFGYSATSGPIEQMGLNELSSADNIELWIYWPVSKN